MKTLRIYLDISVRGGCFDSEFELWSNRLLEALRRREYIAVLSSVTAAEVEQAPEQVKQIHAELIDGGAELLMVSTEAMELLGKYRVRKSSGQSSRTTCFILQWPRSQMLTFWSAGTSATLFVSTRFGSSMQSI